MASELTPSIEDYLETIYLIGQEQQVVRVKDVSARMGVSMPSVNSAVKVLSRSGFVSCEKYGDIHLTDKGRHKGTRIFEKHTGLKGFLHGILGVEEEQAENEACHIEHYISRETMQRLGALVCYLRQECTETGRSQADFFQEYLAQNLTSTATQDQLSRQ